MNGIDLLVLDRDGLRCIRCGTPLRPGFYSSHHRILGNRKDNRPSNKISLCGSGTTDCHGWVHAHPAQARRLGYIVSRHVSRGATAETPVWYNQPGIPGTPARTGWFIIGDNLTLTAYHGEEPA